MSIITVIQELDPTDVYFISLAFIILVLLNIMGVYLFYLGCHWSLEPLIGFVETIGIVVAMVVIHE